MSKVPVLLIFVYLYSVKILVYVSETKTWTKESAVEIIIAVNSGLNIALTGSTLPFHCLLQEGFFPHPCPFGYS